MPSLELKKINFRSTINLMKFYGTMHNVGKLNKGF